MLGASFHCTIGPLPCCVQQTHLHLLPFMPRHKEKVRARAHKYAALNPNNPSMGGANGSSGSDHQQRLNNGMHGVCIASTACRTALTQIHHQSLHATTLAREVGEAALGLHRRSSIAAVWSCHDSATIHGERLTFVGPMIPSSGVTSRYSPSTGVHAGDASHCVSLHPTVLLAAVVAA